MTYVQNTSSGLESGITKLLHIPVSCIYCSFYHGQSDAKYKLVLPSNEKTT